ncbi:MAG: hypothetical protein WCQ95_02495 [Bacteroidota bacterium]
MKKNDKNTTIISVILILGIILTYSNHFYNGFHFDDTHTICNNVYIRDISNFTKFFTDMRTFGTMPDNLGYRPVVTASTAIDYWMGGGYNPFYFHLSMFIVFLLQGVCMFFIILKIFNISYKHQWTKYLVLFTLGWYMLHPGNAETMNYIIARSDLFSTFFVLLAFVCYINKVCKKYYLYLIPLALGVLSKEPATMFPVLLFLYILLFENKVSLTLIFTKQRKQFLNAILKTLPALLFTLAITALVQYISYKQTANSGLLHTVVDGYHLKYLITQPWVLLTYFCSFFFPVSLSSDPDITVFNSFSDIRMYLGFAFVIVMLAIAFIASKKEKYRPISFGILWFFVAAIPTSVLAALTQVSNSHRLFYLYVGISIAVGWALFLFLVKIKPVFQQSTFTKSILAIALCILCTYAFTTYQRNKVWKNNETLWYDILQKGPENPRALMNYGLTLMAKGQYFETEFYFRKAITIWPQWPYLLINMGILKEATHLPNQAETYFLKAINNSAGNNPDAYFYYAKFLYGQKRSLQAMPYLQNAIKISPAHLPSCYLLMTIYQELGYWQQLTTLATETLQLLPGDSPTQSFLNNANNKKSVTPPYAHQIETNPTPESYLSLSLQYYNNGAYQKCIDACHQALKLRPNYSEAYNNICTAYNALKMYDKAADACQKSLQCNPNNEYARNNLKIAQAGKANAIEKPK